MPASTSSNGGRGGSGRGGASAALQLHLPHPPSKGADKVTVRALQHTAALLRDMVVGPDAASGGVNSQV